jgi:hypothetical protein
MHQPPAAQPIFLHSLWRAGSTYLFQVFRRADGRYWAYQEPVHEAALEAKGNPESLSYFSVEQVSALRHPSLQQGYFYELQQAYPAWRSKIDKALIYQDYFSTSPDQPLFGYYEALIQAAPARPVLQDCRTSSRIGAIKKALGGLQLYLWRNPWDQWWSFQINDYFGAVLQVVLSADAPPPAIQLLQEQISFRPFRAESIRAEISHFMARPLDPAADYLVFYTLWALSLLESMRAADLLVNIDALSRNRRYRASIGRRLDALDVPGLDFNDCNIPQAWFGKDDMDFFTPLEEKVYALLREAGVNTQDLQAMQSLRQRFQPRSPASLAGLQEDLRRSRAIARRYAGNAAKVSQSILQENA